jgi:putative ABC transport system permease protein
MDKNDWKRIIRDHLQPLGLSGERELEIAEELAEHLETAYEEAIAAGATEEDARRGALAQIKDWQLLECELSRVEGSKLDQLTRRNNTAAKVIESMRGRRSAMLDGILRDLRYGLRMLFKKKSFSIVVLITLALGIGANTAIFSAVYGVLLRPLPFSEPDRLLVITEKSAAGERMSVAYPNYKDWRDRAQSFKEMASYRPQTFNLTGLERAVRLRGRMVNWNFFQLLDVRPQLGRAFVEQDDQPGAAPTAIISNGIWKERFGGDPAVIGRTLTIDGDQFTLIGVLPPGFQFVRQDDLYVPLGVYLTPQYGILDRGNHFSLFALARLKDGVSLEQARSEMETLAAQLAQEYPNTNSGSGVMMLLLREAIVDNIRPVLLVLLCAVGFILLIACVNSANLMLSRMTDRQREIAVRLALGANRPQILRQLLIESLLFSILGGVAGLLIGVWMKNGLISLAPQNIPRLDDIKMDNTVLFFTISISVLTGLLFGLLPAFHASRGDLNTVLKQGGRTTGGSSRERSRKVLLTIEVALAFVLLIGAGLMLRTVFQLMRVEPGFNAENLLTMKFILPQKNYDEARRRAFHNESLSRVAALPGVRSATYTLSLPIDGSNWNSVFILGDKPVPPRAELPSSAFTPVSSNYFEVMGIRLLKGRVFTEAENENSTRVTVINETMARRFWPNEDPIGKRLKQGWPEDKNPWREVIGVVADVKLNGVDSETPLQAYLPMSQEPSRYLGLIVRTVGDPLLAASMVEQTIYSIDKDLPIFDIRSMDQMLGNAIAQQRLTMVLLAGFAVLALVLAAVGIYGVISYSVTQRTHEIGIRIAMGAQARDVLRLIIGQGMLLTLIGIAAGLITSLAITRLMKSLLFGVSETDPLTYISLSIVLLFVALLACYIPARRAIRIDPMVALRHE